MSITIKGNELYSSNKTDLIKSLTELLNQETPQIKNKKQKVVKTEVDDSDDSLSDEETERKRRRGKG